jgi:hypothetical protein
VEDCSKIIRTLLYFYVVESDPVQTAQYYFVLATSSRMAAENPNSEAKAFF